MTKNNGIPVYMHGNIHAKLQLHYIIFVEISRIINLMAAVYVPTDYTLNRPMHIKASLMTIVSLILC